MESQFDLLAIRVGSVAHAIADAGWKTAIVDNLPYGGTCALRRCDTQRKCLAVTVGVEWSTNMAGKVSLSDKTAVDWADLMTFKRRFATKMPPMLESSCHKSDIITLRGDAGFQSKNSVNIDGVPYQSEYFHIATGGRPAPLNIADEKYLISITEYLELKDLPQRIAFVGGGFIGMEFAHISRRSGASEVTVLKRQSRLLTNIDPDMVDILTEATLDLGIDVQLNATVQCIEPDGSAFKVTYSTPEGQRVLICDTVVHAAGRIPNIESLNFLAFDPRRRWWPSLALPSPHGAAGFLCEASLLQPQDRSGLSVPAAFDAPIVSSGTTSKNQRQSRQQPACGLTRSSVLRAPLPV